MKVQVGYDLIFTIGVALGYYIEMASVSTALRVIF